MIDYEQKYLDELALLDPELRVRVESAIASVEFETDDFTFQEKYEILIEEKQESSELIAEEQEVFFEKLFILMQKKTTPEQETAFQAYIKNN